MNLQRRLIVFLVLIGTSAVIVQIGFIIWRNYSLQTDHALDKQALIAQTTATDVSNAVTNRANDLAVMSQALSLDGLDSIQQHTFLQRWMTQQSAWSDLRLWDSSGALLQQVTRPGMVSNPDLINPDEYLLPTQTGHYYYSPLRLNPSTDALEMTIAVPITSENANQVRWVLAADVNLEAMRASLPIGTYLLNAQGQVVAHHDTAIVRRNTTYTVPEQASIGRGLESDWAVVAFQTIWFGNRQFVLVAEKPVLDVFQGFVVNVIFVFVFVLVILGTTVGAALLLLRRWFGHIHQITQAAHAVQAGDFSRRLPIQSNDELGELSQAFNNVVQQLEDTRRHIDAEIQERLGSLQTVVELNTRIATILNLDRLLQDVVDLVKERFGLYHAHIYLLNDTHDTLVLTSGAGYIGELMVAESRQIRMDNEQSIVAGVARSRRAIVANDVNKSHDFLPHPLLPDTQAEAAFVLVARGQLLGVLDVQSDHADFFDEELAGILEVASVQISTAISNARLFETVERIGRHEQALGTISRRIESATTMDDILQVTVRELGKALRVPYTAIELQLKDKAQ
ncbi:MAG: GAF domain-containing protein [Anaerolineales bacterium]|nr:GAF domain-containing protein [Anaerolineales bacterium]